jgi:N4-gp56 family major capsid protein
MTITTTNALPAPVQKWFDNVLLSRPMPKLIHKQMALKKELPPNSGRIASYRRYTNLATATVPLPDSGLTPPGQVLSAVDIDARIDFYGTYVTITDQVMFINQDPVLNQTVSLLAQSMRETEDELIRNMLASTASVINCIGGVNGDNPSELSRSDIDATVMALLGNDAMMISDNIEGTLKFGTAPIREAFWGMMNTAVLDDLEATVGFISQAQYPSNMNVLNAEWGSVGNVRFLYSSKGSVTPGASLNGNPVYNIFITGQEAYAIIELTQATASFIYTPPGGPTDPLRRLQLGAYKFAQVPRLLNDAWIFNLRATHS